MSLKHVAVTFLGTAVAVAIIFRVPAIRSIVVGA
jgi:hypothetical protein